ncbi:transposase and inactivated derivatives [Candidatus Scalindua japonica]|uniref:Transposase and inactivated derivatives n=1 Tax=Candidatus Scalindua japonica TaxID=1284222 RepID=A0A286TXL4_9BACT|nr:helix-turn-helix domain-containing protein [Candidatus Scalindua japonica]GAX60617.1 transposase and inactivated derivatives [Candidatus Scalindua japonica]
MCLLIMARPLRIEYPSAFYHITTIGVGRQNIFFKDYDRKVFLEKLGDLHEKWGIIFHGYCLMTIHYHLELETPGGGLSRPLQWLNHVYAGYVNKEYKRVGHLFQGRFKSVLVEADEHLHVLSCYIHMNPVRAGIVRRPEEYRWSSYRDYLGTRQCPKWLDVKQTLEMFGVSEKEQRKEYQRFVIMGDEGNPLKEMSFGAILGTAQFVKRMREKLRNRKTEKSDAEISGMIYARPGPGINEICKVVCEAYDFSKEEMCVKGRKGNEGRDMAIYLSRKYARSTCDEIGEHFGGIRPSAVSLGSRRVKDRLKTDKPFKKLVRQLESDVIDFNN